MRERDAQVIDFERGAHDCHLYRSWSERTSVVVPFVREGLANGEHCLLVTGAQSFEAWRCELRAFGVDADHQERRGALQFVTGEAWRIDAASNSIVMVRKTLGLLKPLLVEFKGVRIIGDAEWDLDPPVPPDRVCHWEATANLVFAGLEVRAICQYDVNHYAAGMLHAALRTHPAIIWDGSRHQNADYEAPLILQHEPHLNGSKADRKAVDRMLIRLSEQRSLTDRFAASQKGQNASLN